jgi:hypothetical protein
MDLLRNDTQLIALQAIPRRLEFRRALVFGFQIDLRFAHLLEYGSESLQKAAIVLPAEQSQCQQIH